MNTAAATNRDTAPSPLFRVQPDALLRLKNLQDPPRQEVRRRGRDDTKPVAAGTIRAYTSKQQEWRAFCDEKKYDDRYLVYEDKLMVFLMNCVLSRTAKRQKRIESDESSAIENASRKRNGMTPSEPSKLSKNTVKAYVSAIVNLYEEQRASGINLHTHPRGETLKALLDSLAENEEPEHRRRKSEKSTTPPAQRQLDIHQMPPGLDHVDDIVDSRNYEMARVLDHSTAPDHEVLLGSPIPNDIAVQPATDPQLISEIPKLPPKKRPSKRKSTLSTSRDYLHQVAPELYEQMSSLMRSVQSLEMSLTSTIREQALQISQLKHQIEILTTTAGRDSGNHVIGHPSNGASDVDAFAHIHHTGQYGTPTSRTNAFR
ncbi:uncharacterized protein V1513DRAFT_445186 [Lipomyces chichibuensis]|uniref:uncharacterized protein n=1 Tax=Lipomyces chichibuensis TaxID=1546026 RepID=UPI0033442329